jgi:hypothetical protein
VNTSRAYRPLVATDRGMWSRSSIICRVRGDVGWWGVGVGAEGVQEVCVSCVCVGGGEGGGLIAQAWAAVKLAVPPQAQPAARRDSNEALLCPCASRREQGAVPPHLGQVVLVAAVLASRLGLKQKVAGGQLKHHAGQGPDVGAGVVASAQDDLGRGRDGGYVCVQTVLAACNKRALDGRSQQGGWLGGGREQGVGAKQ